MVLVSPMSIAPYQMAPLKLREFKTQLHELLEHGFIKLSVPPWGTSILFIKKKDDNMSLCIDHRMLNQMNEKLLSTPIDR